MFLEQKPSNSALFFVPFLSSSSPRKVGVRDRCVSVNELLFKKEACNAVLKRHLPGMERKGWRIENARCKRIRQWLSKETNPNNPTSSLWLVFSASALHIIICLYAICPTWYFKHPPPEKKSEQKASEKWELKVFAYFQRPTSNVVRMLHFFLEVERGVDRFCSQFGSLRFSWRYEKVRILTWKIGSKAKAVVKKKLLSSTSF